MRSDLVKAAAVLGGILTVGVLLSVIVLIFGMRWAVSSAISEEVARLEAAIVAASEHVGVQVEHSAVRLERGVTSMETTLAATIQQGTDQLAETHIGVANQVDQTLATQMGGLDERIASGVGQVDQTLRTRMGSLEQTVGRAYEQPVLIRIPHVLPVQGTGGDAPPLAIDANLLPG